MELRLNVSIQYKIKCYRGLQLANQGRNISWSKKNEKQKNKIPLVSIWPEGGAQAAMNQERLLTTTLPRQQWILPTNLEKKKRVKCKNR